MNLRDTIGKRKWTQKATYCIIPFMGDSGKGKAIETEIKSVVISGTGVEAGVNCQLA